MVIVAVTNCDEMDVFVRSLDFRADPPPPLPLRPSPTLVTLCCRRMQTLNSQDPTQLLFWANGTNPKQPSAVYKFDIPAGVTSSKQIKAPTLVRETPPNAFFLDFVSGGFTGGAADPELLVGISNANLYIQNAGTGGKLETRALPATFAVPVTLAYAAGSGACSVVFVFSCLLIRL